LGHPNNYAKADTKIYGNKVYPFLVPFWTKNAPDRILQWS